MTKIYLAGPFFKEKEREFVEEIARQLRCSGHEVYVPMEHKIENGENLPNHEWARKVFEQDIKAIDECDKVIAIYSSLYSDTGTAWECGYAYAKGKEVFINVCKEESDSKNTIKNIKSLMVINGSDNYDGYSSFIQM